MVRDHPVRRDVRQGQRGETLIETLASILILSMVAVAAYSGLTTSVASSVQHRDSAVAETMLRTAAERIQDPTSAYQPLAGCGGAPTYDSLPTWPDAASSVDVNVRFWAGLSGPPDQPGELLFLEPGVCPPTDPGLQLIELSVVTPAGTVERLDVLKRSNDVS